LLTTGKNNDQFIQRPTFSLWHTPNFALLLSTLIMLLGAPYACATSASDNTHPESTLNADAAAINALPTTAINIRPTTGVDKKKHIDLLPHISYYIDGSFNADIANIQNIGAEKWKKNSEKIQNFGKISAPIWFKLTLDKALLNTLHSNSATTDWQPTKTGQNFIRLNYPHHDKVNIFFVHNNRIVRQVHTGDHLPFNSRLIELPSFVFEVPSNVEPLDVYLSIQSEGILQFPLSLITRDELNKKSNEFSFLSGIYFGSILIMLIYNGFIYLTVRDKSYSYYLVYLCSCATLQLVLSGIGFQYIWPDSPVINNYAVILSATFVGVSAITFIKNFIGFDYASARNDDILIKILIIFFLLISLSSVIISYRFALSMTFLNVSLMVFTGFYLGIKYWLKGIKTARYFTLAWFSYLSFVAIYMLENNQFIEPNLITENAISIGSLIELALLSIAFADKLNIEKELRVQAQDALLDAQIKMNKDLDGIVDSRTAELENANLKLKELSVTDALTQLKNRYYFDQTFKKEFQRAARDSLNFSIIMIDIDYFKNINDQHGHLFGDYCLAKSAELIQSVIHRPSDTVARYGGEEIAILLPNTSLDGAMKLAEKIREQFKEFEFHDSDISAFLTVSLGVSSASPNPDTIKKSIKLLDLADQCLYKAKQSGRDQVVGQKCCFD